MWVKMPNFRRKAHVLPVTDHYHNILIVMKKHTFAIVAAATALASLAAVTPASAQVMYSSVAPASVQVVTTTSAPMGQMLFAGSDLTVGSRGQAVSDLQGILSELGYLQVPAGTALGYFGNLTKSAVAKLQAELGVPSTGYFGPMTRAAMIDIYGGRGWISSVDGSYVWGASSAMTSATTTGSSSATSTATSTATTSMNATTLLTDAARLPLSPTGYWQNGVWTNGIPTATTTAGQIAGYWRVNVWYPLVPEGILGQGSPAVDGNMTVTTPTVQSNVGYWYNNVWYPVTSVRGGGYYSTR